MSSSSSSSSSTPITRRKRKRKQSKSKDVTAAPATINTSAVAVQIRHLFQPGHTVFIRETQCVRTITWKTLCGQHEAITQSIPYLLNNTTTLLHATNGRYLYVRRRWPSAADRDPVSGGMTKRRKELLTPFAMMYMRHKEDPSYQQQYWWMSFLGNEKFGKLGTRAQLVELDWEATMAVNAGSKRLCQLFDESSRQSLLRDLWLIVLSYFRSSCCSLCEHNGI